MNFYPDTHMIGDAVLALLPVLTSTIPSFLLGIASYVLTSMALYTLASRRGIGKAWLSWVPVLNVWIIGSLSDQYRYVVKGQYKSKRKVLLILQLAVIVLGIAAAVTCIVTAANLLGSAMYGVLGRDMARMFSSLLGIAGLLLPIIGLSIAKVVIRFMALYDIYTSMDPSNSVLFLVLSILFNVTEPFFLFFNRNKDKGMPPRRESPAQEQPQEPAAEPWETENKDYL